MKNTLLPVKPTLQSSLPTHPCEKVGVDLFQLKDSTYLVVVDYYSKYVEIQKLTSLTSGGVIAALKAIFSCHGIPVEFRSDSGLVRRNRRHLRRRSENTRSERPETVENQSNRDSTESGDA